MKKQLAAIETSRCFTTETKNGKQLFTLGIYYIHTTCQLSLKSSAIASPFVIVDVEGL